MSTDVRGWFNLPKAVKILDVSIIGYGISLIVAFMMYFFILGKTIQNLMPIFLVAILLLFTWNFRSKLLTSSSKDSQKHFFREWVVICTIVIAVIITLILIYPVTY